MESNRKPSLEEALKLVNSPVGQDALDFVDDARQSLAAIFAVVPDMPSLLIHIVGFELIVLEAITLEEEDINKVIHSYLEKFREVCRKGSNKDTYRNIVRIWEKYFEGLVDEEQEDKAP